MHHGAPLLFALVATLLLANATAGDPTQQDLRAPRTLRIERIQAEVRVDGRLDEPVWSQLTPAEGFLQSKPDEGAPVSERTQAYLFYDDESLYIGFRCYDSEPEKIIVRYDARDARTNSDSVNVFLDPFGDRRNGYFFSVNAANGQFDALVSADGSFDSTWDGIWYSGVHRDEQGWSVEIAIPFRSIRFRTGQPWGLNLSRNIARKNEDAAWQFIARFEGRPRPSRAGYLEGIGGLEPGLNLELIPYLAGRWRRGAGNPLDNENRYEGGLDLRWGLLPNLTANLTLNPDFAETEADEINISISRFELFFPEKRAFFNEGSTFFTTPLNLFFTRRVGARLPDGRPQRILLGAKLTGRVGPWTLGLLESRTLRTEFTDPETREVRIAPAANFFVLRVRRDILANSSIGFLTVNRDQAAGDIGSTQRAHAVDLSIVRGSSILWTTQVAYNQNQTTLEGGLQRAAFRSHFNFDSDELEFRLRYKFVGRAFDVSAIGFEPETDRHQTHAAIEWKPFLDRGGIRQIFFEVSHNGNRNTAGAVEDDSHGAELGFEFQNFWFAEVSYEYERVRFFEFTDDFQRLPTTRLYATPNVGFFVRTNESRPVLLNYSFQWRRIVQFRENFVGQAQEHNLGLTARMLRRIKLQASGRLVREFLDDGTPFQVRRLFLTRLNYQFTPRLRYRILAQVANDRRGQEFNINSVIVYDFTARSNFVLGYNYQRRSPGTPEDLGNEFFFKFSYLFQF